MKKKIFSAIALMLIACIAVSCAAAPGAAAPTQETGKANDTNRTQITDLKESRYKSSVLVQMGDDKEDFGSGAVVGKNTVVTCRHVVETETGKVGDKLSVLYGVTDKDGKEHFVKFPVISAKLAPNDEDLATLEVGPGEDGKSIGEVAEIAKMSDGKDVKANDRLSIVGFPGDKPYGTLWKSEGNIVMKEDTFLQLNAYAIGGNSGSPLYDEKDEVVGLINACNKEESFGFLFSDSAKTFIQENMK